MSLRHTNWQAIVAMIAVSLFMEPVRADQEQIKLNGDSPPSTTRATSDPPNVIIILADDLGYGDLGSFGQKLINTPHLDRMAAEGIRFTQAYAGATVCAPSRCCLMTGMHGGHAAVRGNQEVQPEGQLPMPAETVTLAHIMQRAGYATGLIGKWGLGYPGSVSTPEKMGFDEFFGYNCQRKAHEHYPLELWKNNERVVLDGKTYSHDLMTQEALDFIRRHANQRFFLDLSYTLPHQKLQVPELGEYADKDWDSKLKTLAAMISRLDRDVGRIFALLQELKIDSKTLVIFASDNGSAYQNAIFQHSGPLHGHKRDLFEGGIRTPAIIRWPNHVASGVTSNQVWAFWDLLPTLADLTGQHVPPGLDGISVLSSWLDQKAIVHPPLYFEFHEKGFHQAARIGDWKAIRHGVQSPLELYSLPDDLGERNNLAAEHPEHVQEFERFLDTARTDSAVWPIQTPGKPGQAQSKSTSSSP